MDNKRLSFLQKSLKNPILIKKKENLFYLTGRSFDFRAEEYLLVTPSHHSGRSGHLFLGWRGLIVGFGSGLEQITWVKKADRLKNIGKYLNSNQLDIEWGFTLGEQAYLRAKAKGLRVKPQRSMVDEMRQIKEPEEISKIRKSMQIVEKVFERVRRQLRRGRSRQFPTERELANFIHSIGLKLGAEDVSFPPIVASGSNSAIPHHVPSNKRLKAGESIIIDFGFKYKHYCSDFTRTVFLKKVPKKLEIAYNQVEKAYNECISLRVHPKQSNQTDKSPHPSDAFMVQNDKSVTGHQVYQKAVSVLAEKKLDKYFIHSLGHGTGLEIHELPNLSPKSKDVIKDNMVFSIEPGVYFPKVGGIRIEDLVFMENGKCKKFINVLTKLRENVL